MEVTVPLEEFAKQNHLEFYKLMQLVEGHTATNCYLGWRMYDLVPKVINPDGEVMEVLGTKVDFAKEHGLTACGMTILIKHKRAYKDWKPFIEGE